MGGPGATLNAVADSGPGASLMERSALVEGAALVEVAPSVEVSSSSQAVHLEIRSTALGDPLAAVGGEEAALGGPSAGRGGPVTALEGPSEALEDPLAAVEEGKEAAQGGVLGEGRRLRLQRQLERRERRGHGRSPGSSHSSPDLLLASSVDALSHSASSSPGVLGGSARHRDAGQDLPLPLPLSRLLPKSPSKTAMLESEEARPHSSGHQWDRERLRAHRSQNEHGSMSMGTTMRMSSPVWLETIAWRIQNREEERRRKGHAPVLASTVPLVQLTKGTSGPRTRAARRADPGVSLSPSAAARRQKDHTVAPPRESGAARVARVGEQLRVQPGGDHDEEEDGSRNPLASSLRPCSQEDATKSPSEADAHAPLASGLLRVSQEDGIRIPIEAGTHGRQEGSGATAGTSPGASASGDTRCTEGRPEQQEGHLGQGSHRGEGKRGSYPPTVQDGGTPAIKDGGAPAIKDGGAPSIQDGGAPGALGMSQTGHATQSHGRAEPSGGSGDRGMADLPTGKEAPWEASTGASLPVYRLARVEEEEDGVGRVGQVNLLSAVEEELRPSARSRRPSFSDWTRPRAAKNGDRAARRSFEWGSRPLSDSGLRTSPAASPATPRFWRPDTSRAAHEGGTPRESRRRRFSDSLPRNGGRDADGKSDKRLSFSDWLGPRNPWEFLNRPQSSSGM